jgi:hypothetical protein
VVSTAGDGTGAGPRSSGAFSATSVCRESDRTIHSGTQRNPNVFGFLALPSLDAEAGDTSSGRDSPARNPRILLPRGAHGRNSVSWPECSPTSTPAH